MKKHLLSFGFTLALGLGMTTAVMAAPSPGVDNSVNSPSVDNSVDSPSVDNSVEWVTENGVKYWYENGVKQGTEGRGKEIYDPKTDAWYWLDAESNGAIAVNKDVYQETEAGTWGDIVGKDGKNYGKWVRYDAEGHMVKGWNEKDGAKYYFDKQFGTMAKGYATIDGVEYYFNKGTGVLEKTLGEVAGTGWRVVDGVECWYEDGVRQGSSASTSYRGKEIFDPATGAWYWLDNEGGGKKAVNKDVYQDSLAGEWGEYVGEDGQKYGKWVRYDAEGHMVKGWQTVEAGTYYFDTTYGTMAKGNVVIEGKNYTFDVITGILRTEIDSPSVDNTAE